MNDANRRLVIKLLAEAQMKTVPKRQYDHALKRMYQLFEMGVKREAELEEEAARLRVIIAEQSRELTELRSELFAKLGSVSS